MGATRFITALGIMIGLAVGMCGCRKAEEEKDAKGTDGSRSETEVVTGKDTRKTGGENRGSERTEQPKAVVIPDDIRRKADEAFSDGKKVFIWTDTGTPVKVKKASLGGTIPMQYWMFDINYLRSPNDEMQFKPYAAIIFRDPKGKRLQSISCTAGGPKDVSPSGAITAGMAWQKTILTGKGTAFVHLILADESTGGASTEKTPAISNYIEIPIECPEE